MTTLFDRLESALASEGADAAIGRLCAALLERKDYTSLFYARLMKKRHELGVNPVPTGPASDLPPEVHPPYEEAIRDAAREAGGLYLKDGEIAQAWAFYRMIDEPEPVRKALEAYEPGDGDDVQPLVQMTFYEGLLPRKGFDLVLSRYGLCSAITTASGELPHGEEDKLYFVRALIRALYNELRHRLTAEITNRFSVPPAGADAPPDTPGVVDELIADRAYLFEEDAYHIDTSHLSSVVQMSMHLKPCPELDLARELCRYGKRLTGRFVGEDTSPFENGYADYEVYLGVLAGDRVEEGLAHFRAKAETPDDEAGTYPAEVLVNLLVKIGRGREAVEVARKHLAGAGGRQLSCPNLNELCLRFGEFDALAEAARGEGNAVNFLAGRLAAKRGEGRP